jgi:signal transduction histidine kinase
MEQLTLGEFALSITQCNSSDMLEAVADSLRPIADKSSITIAVASDEVTFGGDRSRITRALLNLASNALKFAPPSSAVTLKSLRMGSDICFEVHDTGPGVPNKDIDRIFERFQQADGGDQRHPGGSGLGLAIAKGIVEQHGGKIWAESNVGEGSVFRFTLPLRA